MVLLYKSCIWFYLIQCCSFHHLNLIFSCGIYVYRNVSLTLYVVLLHVNVEKKGQWVTCNKLIIYIYILIYVKIWLNWYTCNGNINSQAWHVSLNSLLWHIRCNILWKNKHFLCYNHDNTYICIMQMSIYLQCPNIQPWERISARKLVNN